MTLARLTEVLALPMSTRVERRVPKTLLLEQEAITTADKRAIRDDLDELLWVAALKPENIGVPAFKDDVREYLEVAVLTGTLRKSAKFGPLTKLIHRAVPYPVVLWVEQEAEVSLSFAHKRSSHGQTRAVVVEEVYLTEPFRPDEPNELEACFLKSLALADLPRTSLHALYQGWMDRVTALDAANITGSFRLVQTPEDAAVRRDAVAAHAQHHRELASLRTQAERETQISRRVDLNLAIKRIESQLAALRTGL